MRSMDHILVMVKIVFVSCLQSTPELQQQLARGDQYSDLDLQRLDVVVIPEAKSL